MLASLASLPMPHAKAKPTTAAVPISYEAAIAELETLLAKLEAGRIPLDELLQGHRRGTELLQYCQNRLKEVEQQVKVLDANEPHTSHAQTEAQP